MTLSVHAIAEMIGAAIPACDLSISGWSIDTRTINPGDCFFALRGPVHDGHDYLAKLPERGAALAIVERASEGIGVLQLVVPDTLAAFQTLARKTRVRWGGKVVGVTGSAGKTTTKDAIAALLSVQFRTGRTIGNYNNHVGVPLSILRLPDDCRVAVIEMGMNHAGEIRGLANIARPQIGVVTNVGWAHTEYFPDGVEGVARAKRELIEGLPASGIAVLNADDPRVREFKNIHPGRSILFGFSDDAEVRAEDFRSCHSHSDQSRAHFRCLGIDFDTPLAGRHGVSNVLAALAVARALEIPPAILRDAVRTLAVGKMRGERSERAGITIINDSYNANPEAMRSMLELLRDAPGRRRIAVLGEMIELGAEAESLHRQIGQFASDQGVDLLVGVRGAARFMVDGSARKAEFFDSPEEAGIFLRKYLRPGDTVLFKGSRGVQVERAIDIAFAEAGK